MAKKKTKESLITLTCTECKSRNYHVNKSKGKVAKGGAPVRLELNKYCPICRKHTTHKESK